LEANGINGEIAAWKENLPQPASQRHGSHGITHGIQEKISRTFHVANQHEDFGVPGFDGQKRNNILGSLKATTMPPIRAFVTLFVDGKPSI
jgi:hypothetical protein